MKCDVTDRDTRSEARCLENLLFRLVIFRGHCAKGFVYSIVAEGEESYHYSWLNLCRRLLIRRRHERQIESNEEAFLQQWIWTSSSVGYILKNNNKKDAA